MLKYKANVKKICTHDHVVKQIMAELGEATVARVVARVKKNPYYIKGQRVSDEDLAKYVRGDLRRLAEAGFINKV
jgi:hypothetical protein